ncbi:hypothetical protein DSO57_1005992 [Entomophthora muscae]|uniref:Uncharacterized protein n=1 Tax=Entomophthora muscae TaxID=34485 RepID=A0ACC2SKR8_9FUNG|nr:hypothetical protein DSO57_1005992 [Entomophthora muscae]
MIDEKNKDLDDDKAEVATSWFDKYYDTSFLKDALPLIYTQFLQQEGPDDLEDAYNASLLNIVVTVLF